MRPASFPHREGTPCALSAFLSRGQPSQGSAFRQGSVGPLCTAGLSLSRGWPF